jgi:hypothetical protein
MAAATLNSVSPSSGPPGTAVTCLGAGFDAGAQVACPGLAATEWVSATELKAAIPAGIVGPPGGTITVLVTVVNEDGSVSGAVEFTVRFPAQTQSWATVDGVCGEVPQFKRGGTIGDPIIEGWIRSITQQVNAAMLARGLSLNPDDWQQPEEETGQPSPAAVLEMIVRYGAAARLAAVIGAQFQAQGEWGLAKNLREDFTAQMKALGSGMYDKVFRPGAATALTDTAFGGGEIETSGGDGDNAFSKDQVF